MQLKGRSIRWLAAVAAASSVVMLAACTPMMAGQMAEAGYNVAKTTLAGPASASSVGADERQKRLQSVLNEVDIGQEVGPVIKSMAEQPKEKSGNAFGFTCYEFTGVYSASESAVIVSHNDRVVFYGNSRCQEEMKVEHFKPDGKYGVVMQSSGVKGQAAGSTVRSSGANVQTFGSKESTSEADVQTPKTAAPGTE